MLESYPISTETAQELFRVLNSMSGCNIIKSMDIGNATYFRKYFIPSSNVAISLSTWKNTPSFRCYKLDGFRFEIITFENFFEALTPEIKKKLIFYLNLFLDR